MKRLTIILVLTVSTTVSVFSQKFNTEKESESPFSLFSNDVKLTNSRIKITNENLENPEVFILDNVNLVATNFKIHDVVHIRTSKSIYTLPVITYTKKLSIISQ